MEQLKYIVDVTLALGQFPSHTEGIKAVQPKDALNFRETIKPLSDYFQNWTNGQKVFEVLGFLRDLTPERNKPLPANKSNDGYCRSLQRAFKKLFTEIKQFRKQLKRGGLLNEQIFPRNETALKRIENNFLEESQRICKFVSMDLMHFEGRKKANIEMARIYKLPKNKRRPRNSQRDGTFVGLIEIIKNQKQISAEKAVEDLHWLLEILGDALSKKDLISEDRLEKIWKNRSKIIPY